MKPTTKDCGGSTQDTSRRRKCLSCEIVEPSRNNYYRGKLLTERDFTDEQRYFTDKHRLHNRALHGWGIVCGLKIKPHPHCPDLKLIVEPGLAIDDCGREIRLTREVQVLLPEAPPKEPAKPCPDYNEPKGEPPPGSYQQQPPEKQEGYSQNPYQQDPYRDDEDKPLPYNPCDDSPVPKHLYLCIAYGECETDFSPAPFDECGCNTDGQQPNRIQEGYDLHLFEEKPDWWDEATEQNCKIEDCEKLFHRGQKNCPPFDKFCCLPLAVIRDTIPGQPVKEEQIDWHGPRRYLSSTSTLEEVIRCILDKLPTKELTRISDINWEHGQRVLCHQFMSEFVGSAQNPRGFEIRFDSKVYAQSIDTRSLQALVAFRPDDITEPRVIELAPAHVEHDEYESDWCRIRIDPGYARRRLDGRNFDLFITLKCNVITGKNGLAVDGNFLATQEGDDVWRMALPTGDNVPGGTFESWIRVRPRPKTTEEYRRSAS